MDALSNPEVEQVTIMSSSQVGKALALDTPVPTPFGWSTIGELHIGDTVFDADGRTAKIIAESPVHTHRSCSSVEFCDGTTIISDDGHMWEVYTRDLKKRLMTTLEIAHIKTKGNISPARVRVAGPLQTEERQLPLDPYVFGVWLGDGNSASAIITIDKRDGVLDNLEAVLGKLEVVDERGPIIQVHLGKSKRAFEFICSRGHPKRFYNGKYQCHHCARETARAYRMGMARTNVGKPTRGGMQGKLKDLGVIGNKRIPGTFLRSSVAQRWRLLQGLMDADGCAAKNGICEICTVNEALAGDVHELVCSLGLKPKVSIQPAKIYGRIISARWRITFVAYQHQPVFSLKRKQDRLRNIDTPGLRPTETTRRSILRIRPVSSVSVKCLAVDSPSHLFLVGESMIPTHNTEFLLNYCGYIIDYDPSPMLIVLPTIEMGMAWSKDRFSPMVRDMEALRDKVSEVRARDSENTLLHKVFKGGQITIAGANSAASLASRPVRILLMDEVDRYPPSAGSEGDPVKLAMMRTANFWNRKIIATSTPTVSGVSRIERLFNASLKHHYHVPCTECGKFQVLVFGQVKWEKEKDQLVKESVYYECIHCRAKLAEKDKAAMVRAGEWRDGLHSEFKARTGTHLGFHISELYSPWSSWQRIVSDFYEDNKSPETLRVWTNTRLGQVFEEEESTSISLDKIAGKIEQYEKLPSGVLMLTAGIDVQDDRLECVVRGWGLGDESWFVERRTLYAPKTSSTLSDVVWNQMKEYLIRPYQHEDGVEMKVSCVCIDSGFRTTKAYEMARAWGRDFFYVYAVKGYGGSGKPLIVKISTNNKFKAKVVIVGVDEAKRIIYDRLVMQDPGPGYMHFNQSCDDEYFSQLTAERYLTKYNKGFPTKIWVKMNGRRNEMLDCEVYALAGKELLNPDYAKIQAKMMKKLKSLDEKPEEKVDEPMNKGRKLRPQFRKNFVNSWRD